MNAYEVEFCDGRKRRIEADGWTVDEGALRFHKKGEYFNVSSCYGVAPGLWVDVRMLEPEVHNSILDDLEALRKNAKRRPS